MTTYFEKELATSKYLLKMYKTAEEAKDEEMMELIRERHTKFEEEIKSKGTTYVRLYMMVESAYERGNEEIDFTDSIWQSDIHSMVEAMREYGIKRFTISSGMSSMAETIMHFQNEGCSMNGIAMVNANYKDFTTGAYKVVPAFVIDVN